MDIKQEDCRIDIEQEDGIIEIEPEDDSNEIEQEDGSIEIRQNDGSNNVEQEDGSIEIGQEDGSNDVEQEDGSNNVEQEDGSIKIGQDDGSNDVEQESSIDSSDSEPQEYFEGKKNIPVFSNTSKRYPTEGVVCHILETSEAKVCQEQPLDCTETKAFIISTDAVDHPDDLRADDLGVWINNAVRKEYCSVHYDNDQHRVTSM